jgi:hypothetical protein
MPQLIVPYQFVAHSPASAAQMNANFTAVANFYNGNLGADNTANNAITNAELKANTIISNNFADNSVTAAKIIDDTVVHSNIANDQLTGTHFWPVAAASNVPAYRVPQNNVWWPTMLPGTISGVSFPAHSSGSSDPIEFTTSTYSFSSILDSGIGYFNIAPEIHSIEIIPNDMTDLNWIYCVWTPTMQVISSTGISFKFYGVPTLQGYVFPWASVRADIDITLISYQQPLPTEL